MVEICHYLQDTPIKRLCDREETMDTQSTSRPWCSRGLAKPDTYSTDVLTTATPHLRIMGHRI